MNKHGTLIISLDFELYWGMRDIVTIEEYKEFLLGARKAIPQILKLFKQYEIHATWATVGLLFFNDSEHLANHLPKEIPSYNDPDLSPYNYINNSSNLDKNYHFAPQLINAIHSTVGQEVATHTFSHYYCGEQGQTESEFKADIESAISIAEDKHIKTKSIVFPRNQWKYLSALDQLGIQSFRGTEAGWMYDHSDYKKQLNPINRITRLTDAYVNLSGHNTYKLSDCIKSKPYNFPSSRQLRPYSKKLSKLDGLRLKRITKAMDNAAKKQEIFHLWWHPHNFGTNIEHNLFFLEKILKHYQGLTHSHEMKSLNMAELSALADT